jgi:hypothetical protein
LGDNLPLCHTRSAVHPLLALAIALIVLGIVLSLVAMTGAIGTSPGWYAMLAGGALGVYVKYVLEGKDKGEGKGKP